MISLNILFIDTLYFGVFSHRTSSFQPAKHKRHNFHHYGGVPRGRWPVGLFRGSIRKLRWRGIRGDISECAVHYSELLFTRVSDVLCYQKWVKLDLIYWWICFSRDSIVTPKNGLYTGSSVPHDSFIWKLNKAVDNWSNLDQRRYSNTILVRCLDIIRLSSDIRMPTACAAFEARWWQTRRGKAEHWLHNRNNSETNTELSNSSVSCLSTIQL